ncbi:MAG TPA: FadR/GntR family transcriptional regulator [Candidatus Dormibacteraeota bacterium]|nr:FadR/GntR family transcriptional regulator [Candidatus Dormibacteraeota bacterium]
MPESPERPALARAALGPTFRPVARRNTYDLVAEDLLLAITSRRLRPGDALPPERELAAAYAVGRSSVREALRVLESRGLLRARSRGTFVVADYGDLLGRALQQLVALEEVGVAELFEVRLTLEVETVTLAARRRTRADLARLDGRIREMEASLESSGRYGAADLAFHTALADASGNRLLVRLMDGIRDVMARAFVAAFEIPGSPERSVVQHRAIHAAVAAGDAAAAADRMREHLTRVELDLTDAAAAPAGRPSEHPLAAGRRPTTGGRGGSRAVPAGVELA